MKTVLVTGAGGFVGRSLVRMLLSKNDFRVIGLARHEADLEEFRGAPGFIGSALDLASESLPFLPVDKVDVLVHLASCQPGRPGLTYDDYCRGNVTTAFMAAEIAKKVSAELVILTSTTAIHGTELHGSIITEETPVDPGNWYGLTKYIAEKVLQFELKQTKARLAVVRCPSLIGAGQNGGLVDTYYRLAREGQPVEIYSNGARRRNMLHVRDLACFIIGLIEQGDLLNDFGVFFAGSQDSLLMKEIAERICRGVGSTSEMRLVDKPIPVDRDIDVDISALVRASNWKPMDMAEALDLYIKEMVQ